MAQTISAITGTSQPRQWVEFERIKQNWKLQDGIKHPYMDQFTVSLERELFKDASISVSYIYRNWKNIIGVYDTLAQYAADRLPGHAPQ